MVKQDSTLTELKTQAHGSLSRVLFTRHWCDLQDQDSENPKRLCRVRSPSLQRSSPLVSHSLNLIENRGPSTAQRWQPQGAISLSTFFVPLNPLSRTLEARNPKVWGVLTWKIAVFNDLFESHEMAIL